MRLISALVVVAALLCLAGGGVRAQSSVFVSFPAGWNLVGGPEGTVFVGATGTLYGLQSGDSSYRTSVPTTPVHAGVGYWAFFPEPTAVRLAGSGQLPFSLQLPARQYVLIGDPAAEPVSVSPGADLLVAYEPASRGYINETVLVPGQGAWAYSEDGVVLTFSSITPPARPPVPSAVATVTPTPAVRPAALAAPQGVRATSLDGTRIAINWLPSVGATGYVLLDATDRHQIAVLPAEAVSYTLVDLVPSSQYCVVIYAYNDGSASPLSDQACAQTLPAG